MSNASSKLLSVAASAGKKLEIENGNNESGSARIRQAGWLLREITLRDKYGSESFLSVMVAERLNELVIELDELAGAQLLFELWIGD